MPGKGYYVTATKPGNAYDVERKNRNLALSAARTLDDQRATDILVLDLRGLVDYTDFFVIASAASLARARGAWRLLDKRLTRAGAKLLNQPERESGWLLADYGDVLVHIFENEGREFYRLEDLWGDAPRIQWQEDTRNK